MRLVFTPLFDEVTRYFYSYFGNLPAEIKLRDWLANKENLERVAHNVTVMVFATHGEPDKLFGDGYTIAVDKSNARIFNGKVAIVIACETAQTLGRLAIDNGAYAYFGFTEPFIFPILSTDNPLEDRYARAVLKPFWNFAYKVLTGRDIFKAFEELQKEIDDTINEWKNSNDPFADMVIKALLWNKEHMILMVNMRPLWVIAKATQTASEQNAKMTSFFTGLFIMMLCDPEASAQLNFLFSTVAMLGGLILASREAS